MGYDGRIQVFDWRKSVERKLMVLGVGLSDKQLAIIKSYDILYLSWSDMEKKIWKTRKAGKLANGWKRGKGKTVHAAMSEDEPDYFDKAVCGANPKISWTILDDTAEVTCPKCLKKLKP